MAPRFIVGVPTTVLDGARFEQDPGSLTTRKDKSPTALRFFYKQDADLL